MLKKYLLYTRCTDKIRPNELVDSTEAHSLREAKYNFEARWNGKYVITLEKGKMNHTVVLTKRYEEPIEEPIIVSARGSGKSRYVRVKIDAIRIEAVKEFADEFKKIAVCGKTSVFRFPYYQISMEAFDNLVKEMAGEG